MGQGEGGQDTWWRRQFGSGAWADTTPTQRIAWAVVGGAGSAVLLGAFWLVLNQALARADQHWERARVSSSPASPCTASRQLGASGEGCAAMMAESVARRTGGATTRLGSTSR